MSAQQILLYNVFPIAAYLIGSLVPGYWIGKAKGIDIRTKGSKNIGATNVARVIGQKAGLAAFALDLLKGFLPTFFLGWFAAGHGSPLGTRAYFLFGILYGSFAILGHTFPIFLGFKGGKAVATGCGVFLALAPFATIAAGLLWLVLFLVFRIVSLGSIFAAIVLPVAAFVQSLRDRTLNETWPVIAFAAVVAALVILRHHSNIRRLLAGTESKFEEERPLMSNVTIIGDGGWGTAIAIVLHANGHRVTQWSAFPDYAAVLEQTRENPKFLPGVKIPAAVRITASVEEAMADAQFVVCAVPTQFIRPVLRKFRGVYDPKVPMVNVAKGIENGTLMRGTQVIRDVLGNVPVGALSGPSHAEEVSRGKPTIVVAASSRREIATLIQRTFACPKLRVYTNPDLIGVELGGALKNVIAVAAGICDGLQLGDNTKSALLTRGLAEMARLGVAMGARRSTFAGLSGVGNLITTAVSPHGRNRWAGEQIGKGHPLAEVLKMTEKVAEGIWTTKSAVALARRHHVEMPITQELYQILFRGKDPARAVIDLMNRAPKAEVESTR